MQNIRKEIMVKILEKLWDVEDKQLNNKIEIRLFHKLVDELPFEVFNNTNECDKVKHFLNKSLYN